MLLPAAFMESRAANGVVLLPTKKGTQGAARVSLIPIMEQQTAWRQLDLLNRDQVP